MVDFLTGANGLRGDDRSATRILRRHRQRVDRSMPTNSRSITDERLLADKFDFVETQREVLRSRS